MAEAIVSVGASADKSLSHSFNIVHPSLVPHALISAETQVQLLSVIDATGSATIEDCIEGLHRGPARPPGAPVAQRNTSGQSPSGGPDHRHRRRSGLPDVAPCQGGGAVHACLVRHAGDLTVLNGLPDGDHVSGQEYDQMRLFVTAAALQLRHAGIMFTSGNARFAMAGPRTMADDLGPLRLDDLPDGIAYELNGCGVTAWAVERSDRSWLLLKGSEIRRKVVTSANSSASQRRAEWLHGGVLVEGDGCYRLTRDVVFNTGSGAAHFVLGSKSKSLAGWVPIAEPELPDPVI